MADTSVIQTTVNTWVNTASIDWFARRLEQFAALNLGDADRQPDNPHSKEWRREAGLALDAARQLRAAIEIVSRLPGDW